MTYMNNKKILFNAFIDAKDALFRAIQLRDDAENIFSENSPLMQKLDAIVESLSVTGDIHYEIGGGANISFDDFNAWMSDEREIGPCTSCFHRTLTDEKGYHRCALAHGDAQFSSEYACREWKPKNE